MIRADSANAKDRFIARDWAFNVLAHLARLDSVSPAAVAEDDYAQNLELEQMGGCDVAYAGIADETLTDAALKAHVMASSTSFQSKLLARYLRDSLDGGDSRAGV